MDKEQENQMNKQALIDDIENPSTIGGTSIDYVFGVSHERERILEIINKHLPDNEVSVPVEPTEAMIDAMFDLMTFKSHETPVTVINKVYKAMLQAHKSKEV